MLDEARKRIASRPGKYVDHIYGEKEAGGTSVLYISSVPFEKLGFPDVGTHSYPGLSAKALHAVPPAVMAVGAMLGGIYAFLRRRTDARHHHPAFEPLGRKLWTPFNIAMLVLVAFGVLSLAFRFAFGLGRTTQ